MNCCTSTSDLGCFYSCDTITTGVSADTTGTYTLVIMPDGQKVTTNTVTAGAEITFGAGFVKEDGVTIFKVLEPDGTYLTNGDGDDCFQVDMSPALDPTLAVTTCSEFDVEYGGDNADAFVNN